MEERSKREHSLGKYEYIELKNLLKIMDLVNSGGEAKMMILSGEILLNGEPETRRGKKLRVGDVISLDDLDIHIVE